VELSANTADLAPLRGKDPLAGWVDAFSQKDPARAARYRYAVALFLGYPEPSGRPDWAKNYIAERSPQTLNKYRFAIAEFFEFLTRLRGRVVPPHEVTRRDAFEYTEWLANRGQGRWDFSLEAEKLRDGDRDEDLAIYETLKRLGQGKLSDIARELPSRVKREHPPSEAQVATNLLNEYWLDDRLKRLIAQDVIRRTPTMVELRRQYPRAGLDEAVNPDLYTYTCIPVRPVSRSTIVQRLSALSAFWGVMQKGENADPSQKALLDYNVFEDALERASRGLKKEKREASLSKRPTVELVSRIVDAAQGNKLTDKRNLALIWFLLLTGSRIGAALNLRRAEPRTEADRLRYPGWLDRSSDPVSVVMLEKGGTRRRVALPPMVLDALNVFWARLAEAITDDLDQTTPRYRYQLLLREPDAPLFPPLGLWGNNVPTEDSDWGQWAYRKPMRRQAVQMALCRLSNKAGLTEGERRRIHPHGFRHLAAEAMVAEGDLRDAQRRLGHESLVTTEGYLPGEQDEVLRSAQSEILEYFSKHGFHPGATVVRETIVLAAAPREITTMGQPVVEAEFIEDEETLRAAREPGALAELPVGPPAPPRLPRAVGAPEEARLTGFGQTVSPGAPAEPYEQMAEGQKPKDLVWSSLPQAKWIADHYPKLPRSYGIGKVSLLPWYNPNAPSPWPVLAPAQAYPELAAEQNFLNGLERLYDEWAETAPTKTLALGQWLYFLGMLTVALENKIAPNYSWVSYNAAASVGDDLRAHDDAWLVAWFRKNAHTFTVAQRRFSSAPKPTAGEAAAVYWERVREDIGIAGAVPAVPQLPDWYFEVDPVHAIYERDKEEFDAFVRWLQKLVGAKGSELRTEEKDEQLGFFEKSLDSNEDRARRFMEEFYGLVKEIKAPARDRSAGEQRQLERQREAIRGYVFTEFGIRLPKKADITDPTRVQERISRMLREAFPSHSPEEVKNVLGDSRMFSPAAFRILPGSHTIEHSPEFRERFAQEHRGKDSECVMRRIARAMWEKVRAWEFQSAAAPSARKLTAAEQQRELFVTLLAGLAYVVPCPADVEKAMVEAGVRRPSPIEVARYVNERIRIMAEGGEPEDAVDEVVADIVDVYEEQTQPVARPKRHPRPNTSELIANARRVAPHPIRLVAATFWPV